MSNPISKIHRASRPLVYLGLALIACGLWSLMPSPAQAAQQGMQLNKNVQVDGIYVLLSDLVVNAGIKGEVRLFRSPNPGTTGRVSVKRILEAAAKQGLIIPNPPSFKTVTIKRNSRVIDLRELKDLIKDRLDDRVSGSMGDGKLRIILPDDLKQLHVDPQVRSELSLSSLDWASRSGRFTARFSISGADPIILKGAAIMMVEVAVVKTPISRGKIISRSDLDLKFVKATGRKSQEFAKFEEMIGQSARRQLQAGRPIRLRDLEAPKLIYKNQLVTIVLQLPGLVLRTEGKALTDATKGETVRVLNTQSKRIIHGTAKASGLVYVTLAGANGSGS